MYSSTLERVRFRFSSATRSIKMLTVHHLGISQSERIVWLCEELEIPYKLVKHTRDPLLSPASLKDLPGNETGKAPFIEDPEAGITLSESGAVAEYINEKYGEGRLAINRPGDAEYTDFLHWFHYANGTLQPSMITNMWVEAGGMASDSMMAQFAASRLAAALKLMDDRLKDNQWLAGEKFTIADIMSVYPVTTQRYFGPRCSLAGYDNLLRWLRDCAARPAFKRAMEKGDPEMRILLGPEPPEKGMFEAGGVKSDHWKK